jgi:pimeloyl-ACP methyl ester carboxylesterase
MSVRNGRTQAGLQYVYDNTAATRAALLLVHPLGADMRFWDACANTWRGAVSFVACDLRAAGNSAGSDEPVTIARHVDDLEALRAELGIAAVIPVGCAIGAMTAIAYAARQPACSMALALTNPTLRTAKHAREMLSARAAAVASQGMAAIMPGAVDKAFLEQPRDSRWAQYAERFAAQDPQAYAASILGILDADVTREASEMHCPALVVAGAHDVLLPPEQALMVHESLPRSRYVVFDDAAHFLPYQQPRRFASLVLDFARESGCLQ